MSDLVERAYRRHYADVYRFLRRRTGDPDRSEDLAQEVFVAAAAALPTMEERGSVLPWLYTVAQRRFADEARRRIRLARVLQAPVARTPEFGPEVAAAVRSALGRLPAGQREVLVLKLLRGLRFAEIAAELETTEYAAKMRFSRALRALRDELAEDGVTP